jgi:hypothetical protein
MNNHKRTILIASVIFILVITLSQCIQQEVKDTATLITHPNGKAFAGSLSCQKCHASIYDSFVHTAHYLTSRPALKEYVKGTFTENENAYLFDSSKVVMEMAGDDMYQVAYVNGKKERMQRFDIVIGSGRKGQTYLYWRNNQLFQLPISWFVPGHTWVNSPGYPDKILFDRPIPGRCLDCHSTIFKSVYMPGQPDIFDREKIIYGVDCERCHGPAAEHVTFHEQHSGKKDGRYIINATTLSRKQQLEACALCHSGMGENTRPSFSFLPGDTLSHFFLPGTTTDTADLDVHGNQYGLLTASKCFRASQNMTCSSCHNLHKQERDDLATFSQRCMNCHTSNSDHFCAKAHDIGPSIINNCIDCHMPLKPSKALTLQVSGKKDVIPDLVRTHLIAIYNKKQFVH